MTSWWRIRCDDCRGRGVALDETGAHRKRRVIKNGKLWFEEVICGSCRGATFLIESPDGSRRPETPAERSEREREQLDDLKRYLGVP
jgi:hypothetical protein